MTFDDKQAYLTGLGQLVKVVDFNNLSWFTEARPGDNYGCFNNSGPGGVIPVQETSILASSHKGMKFTIATNTGAAGAGQFFTNFSTDLSTQFGENTEFFIQYQQWFGPFFATHKYNDGGGWKQSIIGTGDKTGCSSGSFVVPPCFTSCSDLEVVNQNTNHRGIPQMYNSCTGCSGHNTPDLPFEPFEDSGPIGSFPDGAPNFQNAYNDGSGHYCTYTPVVNGGDISHCFPYYPSELITFTVHVIVGPRVNDTFTSSHVNLYAAREGATTYSQLLNWGPYGLCAGPVSADEKFGKVWLLPYNTGKNSAETHTTDYTIYYNLLIGSGAPPSVIFTTTENSASRIAMVLR